MKNNAKKIIIKEEFPKNFHRSPAKHIISSIYFKKLEEKNYDFSPKISSENLTANRLYSASNISSKKKSKHLQKKSRNIINTQPCESSKKFSSYNIKSTEVGDTNSIKNNFRYNNTNTNHKKINGLNHSCCSLREFRNCIIKDYTNNLLKKTKNNKNKSVMLCDNLRNYFDDTTTSTTNFNNSNLLYIKKCSKNYNNSDRVSSKNSRKNIRNENNTKTTQLTNNINIYNKNNKYNKNQIRNNFSPHSKLELYINKNYSNNINVNKTSLNKLNNNANNISSNFSPTQISWKYSRDTNPISETINSNNICPSKTKIQESTETKNTSQKKYINNKKKEKNERKTKFLSSSVGPLAKKYNNKRNYTKLIYSNKSRNNKCLKNKGRNKSQSNIINSSTKNNIYVKNKISTDDVCSEQISIEEMHFIFVKIAQKKKKIFFEK